LSPAQRSGDVRTVSWRRDAPAAGQTPNAQRQTPNVKRGHHPGRTRRAERFAVAHGQATGPCHPVGGSFQTEAAPEPFARANPISRSRHRTHVWQGRSYGKSRRSFNCSQVRPVGIRRSSSRIAFLNSSYRISRDQSCRTTPSLATAGAFAAAHGQEAVVERESFVSDLSRIGGGMSSCRAIKTRALDMAGKGLTTPSSATAERGALAAETWRGQDGRRRRDGE
jgi:hypothetical protein